MMIYATRSNILRRMRRIPDEQINILQSSQFESPMILGISAKCQDVDDTALRSPDPQLPGPTDPRIVLANPINQTFANT